MNELKIFESEEFGCVRTVIVNGEPYFVGKDIAEILGYTNPSKALADHVDEDDKLNNESLSSLGQRGGWLINESGFYSLILSSKLPTAKKFKRWVTSEVLPTLRKTGSYQMKPLSIPEQIQLLAQGNVELEKKVDAVSSRMDTLEQDMPLYGCEIDEVKSHVNRKGVKVLGGKQSEAYQDASIRGSVYSDMYRQLKREYGAVSSYKSIKRKYMADVHEFIDCYEPPTVLAEQIEDANAQLRM
ncbi:MAG: BRO family protein [bacterium]|nr:BRO family protein [bacterium]